MKWRFVVGAFALMLGLAACGGEGASNDGAAPSCEAGDTLCGSSCVDTSSDTRHCGACGVACDTGEVCSAGACTTSCPGGQALCGGGCFDLDSTAAHCGGCGVACADDEACSDGACVPACPDGQSACEGGCFDLDASAANCGACGTTCGTGEVCLEGACVANCPAGQTACDGACFNVATSNDHCGACGNACADGEVCTDGACRLSCGAGLTACDGSCRDLGTDRANCGGCGTVCAAGELCVDGACELRCGPGTTECNGSCVDTGNDRANCGGCGLACEADEICSAGSCVPFCGTWAQDICDGACTNLQVDPLHCGACGNACADGQVCSEGACVEACAPGTDVCADGCTSFDHDPANCGGCGNVCSGATNAIPVCGAGGCERLCMPSYGDCDRDLGTRNTNGCEAPLQIDPGNCGACGVACPRPPHATAGCTAGVCGIGQCDTGWADCDGNPANGCEVDIRGDDANCGQCGFACGVGTECVDGACSLPGFADVCASAATLVPGPNAVHWEARGIEYLTRPPSCANSNSAPSKGDIVLRYTASATGSVKLGIPKEASDLLYLVVSDQPCGEPTEYACRADYSNAAMDTSFPVTAGTTYSIYMVAATGTASNPYDLPNPLELTLTEFPGPGGAGLGDTCGSPLTLVEGANTLTWNAGGNDHFRKQPSCGTASNAPLGPDVVFKYTPTFTGAVELYTTRGSARSLYVVVSEGVCGATDAPLACTSVPTSAAQGRTVFPVTANTDYFVHVVAFATPHTTNPGPLDNPLTLTLNPIDCGALAPTVTTLTPANGTALGSSTPVFVADLSHEARRDAGTVTITGNKGTSHTFALPSPFVTFSTDGKKLTIDPEGFLRSGEQVTVTLSLATADCGVPFAPAQWTVTAPPTACTPGDDGMVGTTQTRIRLPAVVSSMFTRHYVEVDDDANGWVYIGTTDKLVRMSKDGQRLEDVFLRGGLTTTHLGNAMLVDGPNVYTLDHKTTASTISQGHLWRISANGGATWTPTEAISWPSAPGDGFRGIAKHGGRIYLITNESTLTTDTEIWSFDPAAGAPAPATRVLTFGANSYTLCTGLAVDANSFFTACRKGGSGSNYAIVRVDRTTGSAVEISTTAPVSTTAMALHVKDRDADGNADYVYVHGAAEQGFAVCAPYTAAPYTFEHFRYGTRTSNAFGMDFDPADNALWVFDPDSPYEFVKIQ